MVEPHTKEADAKHAEELCKLVNERYGYTRALSIALSRFNLKPHEIASLVNMARTRELFAFEAALNLKEVKQTKTEDQLTRKDVKLLNDAINDKQELTKHERKDIKFDRTIARMRTAVRKAYALVVKLENANKAVLENPLDAQNASMASFYKDKPVR